MDIRASDMALFDYPQEVDQTNQLFKEKLRKERQKAIFGFDDNTTVYPINNGLYGFAFFDSGLEEWFCVSGSFEHLYGIYRGINLLNDMDDDTKGIHHSAFFVLNTNHEPLCIIPHAKMTAEQTSRMEGLEVDYDKTFADLIIMGENTTPPKLKFEI